MLKLYKIKSFYKNWPKESKFEINRVREMQISDVEAYSNILVQNGRRFTDEFFVAQGIQKEFFEDAPEPDLGANAKLIPEKKDMSAKPSLIEALKKK